MGEKQWRIAPLHDLVHNKQISYGIVQPGNSQEEGVPIVRVKDIVGGQIRMDEPMRVGTEIAHRHRKTTLEGGEVLLTLVGSVGASAVVPRSMDGWNVARAIAVLRPAGVTPDWLKLCLESSETQLQIMAMLNTTVQATLNLSDLKGITVPFPPEAERRGITDVIGALDDKIATNTKLAQTGDQLVRAWYADACLGTEDSINLGSVIANVRDGVSANEFEANDRYVGLEHVPRRQTWLNDFGHISDITSNKSRFAAGDILFGKLRPYFHKVVTAPFDGICSTDILVLRPLEARKFGWLLAALTSDDVVAAADAASVGTRMPRAKWSHMATIELPLPTEEVIGRLSDQVNGLAAAANAALREDITLAAARDTLLPQLMSGKLRVRDAEQLVEEVV